MSLSRSVMVSIKLVIRLPENLVKVDLDKCNLGVISMLRIIFVICAKTETHCYVVVVTADRAGYLLSMLLALKEGKGGNSLFP